nr:hypothetical protein [Pseudooceanicola aestuarii]
MLVGRYQSPERGGMKIGEWVAMGLALLWLVGSLLFFVVLGPDAGAEPGLTSGGGTALQSVMVLVAVFLPVAIIWMGLMAMRSARVMREEAQRLQSAVDAIRHAYVVQAQRGSTSPDASVAKKLEEIAEATRKTESALAIFTTSRETLPPPGPAPRRADPRQDEAENQAPLPLLGTRTEEMAPPLDTGDFIRAINFPETAEDEEGFSALRRALKDRGTALLIQAAQDILTLMSQDGIYMDDLRPDRARVEIWRRFAQGERGRQVAALGGVRDRSSLALAAGRMKQDPIFRDAAHHFLRRFDKTLIEFEKTASDQDIVDMADTRTARAFMLLGRVAGIFD